ncbi:hypothetical protein SAMN05216266_11044 [Amycolatopsis marina]|uniref:Uncharacterized protein n=1 Tax=Amycolatopsis marina TaxID=490629 RepID=A0A1I1APY6_9PSEU|nr:hypothetical protein SAMN05216266_11044 [Amycolatopsis marina]
MAVASTCVTGRDRRLVFEHLSGFTTGDRFPFVLVGYPGPSD